MTAYLYAYVVLTMIEMGILFIMVRQNNVQGKCLATTFGITFGLGLGILANKLLEIL